MKKRVSVILLLTVMLVGLAGCLSGCGGMSSEATASSEAPTAGKSYTILDDLNSKEYRLVVETGSACALAAMDVFPKAELVYSNMAADCFKMVQDGKVDGYVCERVTYEKAVQGNTALAKDLTVLNGKIGTIDIAVGIPKERDDFLRLVNRFIMEIKADGCRFVNDVLQISERKKGIFRRLPVERSHGKIIVLPLTDSELLCEVFEGIEGVASIELFVVLAVTALNLSIVSGGERPDFFVPDAKLRQSLLKERQRFLLAVSHFVCKFKSVVRLDAFNRIWKLLYNVL